MFKYIKFWQEAALDALLVWLLDEGYSVYLYIYIYIYIYICVFIYLFMYTNVGMYVRVCVSMYACIHVFKHMCVCMYDLYVSVSVSVYVKPYNVCLRVQ